MYECDWVDKSAAIRRLVYIMSSTTDKRLIYQAGPFNDVTVATFISVSILEQGHYLEAKM